MTAVSMASVFASAVPTAKILQRQCFYKKYGGKYLRACCRTCSLIEDGIAYKAFACIVVMQRKVVQQGKWQAKEITYKRRR